MRIWHGRTFENILSRMNAASLKPVMSTLIRLSESAVTRMLTEFFGTVLGWPELEVPRESGVDKVGD